MTDQPNQVVRIPIHIKAKIDALEAAQNYYTILRDREWLGSEDEVAAAAANLSAARHQLELSIKNYITKRAKK